MKNILSIIFLAVLAFGCKKGNEPNPDQTAAATPKKEYNYTVSVINKKDQNAGVIGDTLILKINNVQKIKQTGAQVTEAFTFTCKTGDKVYLYYNPGKIASGQKYIVYENWLTMYFNSLNNYETSFDGCRCIGVYNEVAK
jgi:hypothetical protein